MPIINLVYEAPEQGGWQPGANTIVYYPFTSDLDDYSGNGYDLTAYNGATINSLSGLNCLDLTSSNSYCSTAVATLPQQGQARTNMCWVQWKYIGQYAVWHYGTQNYNQEDCVWRNDNEAVGGNPGGIAWSSYGNSMIAGVRGIPCERMHIAVVVNGSGSAGQQFYINGVPAQGATLTVNTNGATLRVGAGVNGQLPLNGYIRDFIIEDKARTAQEIADYYNSTKSDYEISFSDFQEVEYIQTTGTQWIDTGYKYISPNKVKYELSYNLTSAGGVSYFGSRTQSGTGTGWSGIPYGGAIYSNTSNFGNFATSVGSDYILSVEFIPSTSKTNLIQYTNGTQTYNQTYSVASYMPPTQTKNIGLFCDINGNGTAIQLAQMKAYSFKIWVNDELVRDLMPCYRKSDGVIGMYDSINNKFYANAGSGAFTKGPDVN